ncbi:MAG: hypothetical protein JWM91_3891 [Rhodospirillales bacterium]|nr:hypothetical protein [Rhodospirillales bacterium]
MGRRWKEFTINVKRALVGFSALLLSAIAAPAGAVNLLTNGSFEQTSLSTSGFVTNSDLTGWMTTSGYTFEVFPGMETTTGIGSGVKLYPGPAATCWRAPCGASSFMAMCAGASAGLNG